MYIHLLLSILHALQNEFKRDQLEVYIGGNYPGGVLSQSFKLLPIANRYLLEDLCNFLSLFEIGESVAAGGPTCYLDEFTRDLRNLSKSLLKLTCNIIVGQDIYLHGYLCLNRNTFGCVSPMFAKE